MRIKLLSTCVGNATINILSNSLEWKAKVVINIFPKICPHLQVYLGIFQPNLKAGNFVSISRKHTEQKKLVWHKCLIKEQKGHIGGHQNLFKSRYTLSKMYIISWGREQEDFFLFFFLSDGLIFWMCVKFLAFRKPDPRTCHYFTKVLGSCSHKLCFLMWCFPINSLTVPVWERTSLVSKGCLVCCATYQTALFSL